MVVAYCAANHFCLGIDIGGECGALLVSLERMSRLRAMLLGANYGDKVIPLSPTMLVCYV
jgi:hypothetical protein